jgi:simple sugar transport system ATP-binding protein
MRLCDNATVLRDGKVTATARVADTTPQELSRAMTGRDIERVVKAQHPEGTRPGQPVLRLDGFTVRGEDGRALVEDVVFEVRSGEIVAIAGVAGNGQTELVEALVGLRQPDGGAVLLHGRDVSRSTVAERRAAGMAYVPEDRGHVGAALGASIGQNLVMGFQRRPAISRHGILKPDGIRRWAQNLIRRYTIKASGPAAPASSLSGGNLQKVTLARELSHGAPCLIAEQPTRGLDVGAIEFVHQQLLRYRRDGHAILLVSAELSEILTLADRILVMFEGRIFGEVRAEEATEEGLGLMMAGVHQMSAAGETPT